MTVQTESLSNSQWINLLRSKDIVLALAVILIIGLMLVPLPPIAMDFLVVFNLALSIGVMLLSMYIARPMDFSVFPSVLLLVTLFRLGLNILVIAHKCKC